MKTNKSYLLLAAVLTFLFSLQPTHTLAQNISTGDNKQGVESNTSTTSKSENQAKYSIPSIYKQKLDTFLKNDLPIIKIDSTSSWKFTAEFVKKEMESDWGISKNNQMLFVWHSIYGQFTGKDLYDGRDGDSIRYEDFINKQIAENKRQIAAQDQQIAAQDQQIAENKRQIAAQDQQIAAQDQQIAANEQQIAEKTKEIMRADSVGIKKMVNFYEKRSKLTQDEFIKLKDTFKWFIDDCKVRGIDYKAILRKEVGDEKIVKDILKFYEIE